VCLFYYYYYYYLHISIYRYILFYCIYNMFNLIAIYLYFITYIQCIIIQLNNSNNNNNNNNNNNINSNNNNNNNNNNNATNNNNRLYRPDKTILVLEPNLSELLIFSLPTATNTNSTNNYNPSGYKSNNRIIDTQIFDMRHTVLDDETKRSIHKELKTFLIMQKVSVYRKSDIVFKNLPFIIIFYFFLFISLSLLSLSDRSVLHPHYY
jgi:hypothetical protein